MKVLLGTFGILFLIFQNGYGSAGTATSVTENFDLPEGYFIFPDDNVAYKIYKNRKTWNEARLQCISDGGHLAIVDNLDEIIHIRSIVTGTEDWLYVGIYKPVGSQEWIRVDNGLPVASPSWEPPPNLDDQNCLVIPTYKYELMSIKCELAEAQSVCEIPIRGNRFFTNSNTSLENGEILGTTQAAPRLGSGSLPEGYSIPPGHNVAYKIYKDRMTWDEALARCVSDGGHLAIADTWMKIKHIKDIEPGLDTFLHAGVYRPLGSENWIRVDNNEPPSSMIWGDRKFLDEFWGLTFVTNRPYCTVISAKEFQLLSVDCQWRQHSVCEIPIDDSLETRKVLHPDSLPEGYSIIANENVAYKIYKDEKIWEEARARCISEGGDLAIADTYDKIERIKSISSGLVSSSFVGIRKRVGSQEWITIHNGKPVKSMPWGEFPLVQDVACAVILKHSIGLWNRNCRSPMHSICEISITTNDTFAQQAETIETTTQVSSSILLPKGYSILTNEKVAYKLYKDQVTLDQARARCIADGGDLATRDTLDKIKRMESTKFGIRNWSTVEIHKPITAETFNYNFLGRSGFLFGSYRRQSYPFRTNCFGRPETNPSLRYIDYKKRLSVCEIPINENYYDTNKTKTSEDAESINATTSQAYSVSTVFPEGHLLYRDEKIVYKIYKDRVKWDVARDRCISDGGDLAVIDTVDKIQFIRSINTGEQDWISVGIYKPPSLRRWRRVDNGRVTAIPWGEFYDMDRRACAVLPLNGIRLWNVDCQWSQQSICEIPIGKYNSSTNDGIASVEADSINATTQATSSITIPKGYSIFPDENVAYKIYEDKITWDEARARCILDGGYLAIADTIEKIELIKSLIKSDKNNWFSVGVHKPFGYRQWIRIDNGLPVTPMPWRNFPTFEGRACTVMPRWGTRLYNVKCGWKQGSVCEIVIDENHRPRVILVLR